MSKEELAGGASLDAVRPRGRAWRLWTAIVAKVMQPGGDTEWIIVRNFKNDRIRLSDGSWTTQRYYMHRVYNGSVQTQRASPEQIKAADEALDEDAGRAW